MAVTTGVLVMLPMSMRVSYLVVLIPVRNVFGGVPMMRGGAWMTNFCRCPWRGQCPESTPCESICLKHETPGVCDFCGFHVFDEKAAAKEVSRDV